MDREGGAGPEAATGWRPKASSTASWVVYDLANTIFSFNILSIFFPLWLRRDLDLPDSVFAIGTSVSMAIVLLVSPALGALSDRARRRIPFLVASTLVCVAFTLPLGVVPWTTAIVFFVLANAGFQSGLIFYDAMLAVVSTPATRGRVGAIGVGVGYIGSFAGLGLGRVILARDESLDALVFAATALAFVILSLPIFFFLREPPRAGTRLTPRVLLETTRASFAGLGRLARGREFPSLRRFLLGRIFYTDAANTMIAFMGVYAVEEAAFSEAEVTLVLAAGILGAVALAPLWGVMVDRFGPRHTLLVVILLWMFALLNIALIPLLQLPKEVFYPLAFLLGGALGGTWSADRPLMLGLAPPQRLGEFYGYYSMVGRFAAIFGPLVWALVVDALGLGRPMAVLSLLVFMVVALVVILGVPDPTHPGPTRLAPYLPWRLPTGEASPLPRRWWTRFPATLVYSVVTTVIFLIYRNAQNRIPPEVVEAFVYRIPRLFTDIPQTLLNFVTAVWVSHNLVQLVYVLTLVALFAAIVEIREGTPRAAALFYGISIVAGIVAGVLLHVFRALWDADWIDRAWDQAWSGGSAGAFGLMGVLAARARRPWLLLAVFTFWELNVGLWYLRSYTPAFHLTALALGFVAARRFFPPRAAPAPASAAKHRVPTAGAR